MRLLAIMGVILAVGLPASAQTSWPNQREGDFVIKDFRFASGETLPELRIHYITLGTPRRNAAGAITNGVLLFPTASAPGTRASRATPCVTSSLGTAIATW
jgi:homoserine O-acetyltransferase